MSQVIIQLLINGLKNILKIHGRIQNYKVHSKCCLLWLLPQSWLQPVCYKVVI
jgi:hypothetical protein